MSSAGSHASPTLPAVDERLVAPETRYEIDDGKLVYVAPADEPHGTCHARLALLLGAHAAAPYEVAVDMLTRTSETSDIAPDVSVFPAARDERTGGRRLEELAFEVVSTQSLADAGRKAAKLMTRGVRRVFGIDVERKRALEWSSELGAWGMLEATSAISDRTLVVPLPVEALVRIAAIDDAVVTAMLAKRPPVLVSALATTKAEGHLEGRLEGASSALLTLLAARGLTPAPDERARILGERDPRRLDRWLARATACATIGELFAT